MLEEKEEEEKEEEKKDETAYFTHEDITSDYYQVIIQVKTI